MDIRDVRHIKISAICHKNLPAFVQRKCKIEKEFRGHVILGVDLQDVREIIGHLIDLSYPFEYLV